MSVINQMLQDLEQRRAIAAGESPLGGVSASSVSMRTSAPVNVILLGVVFALIIVIAMLFLSQHYMQSPVLSQGIVKSTIKDTDVGHENVSEIVVASSADSMQSVETVPGAEEITVANSSVATTNVADTKVPQVATRSVEKKSNEIKSTEKQIKKVKKPVVVSRKESMIEHNEGLAEEENDLSSPVFIDKRIRPLSAAQEAQQHFQQAVTHLGSRKQVQAYEELNKALSLDAGHVRARETLVALLLNTGRVSEAEAVLQEGLNINPGEAGLAKVYARILADQGNLEKSIALLEHAQPVVASDPEYHALLAAFYQRAGKYGQAVQSYQKILRVRPGVAQWWMGLGLSYESIGEPAQALSSYERARRVGGLTADVKKFVIERINVLAPTLSKLAKAGGIAKE